LSGDSGCVLEPLVKIPSFTNRYIYAYEASRPDASNTDSGIANTRACARAGVMPWTNLTYSQAQTACAAAGGRLCTEAEWQAACSYYSGTACGWSYAEGVAGHDCHAYEMPTCNGNDRVPGNDAVLATGSLQYCYRDHTSTLPTSRVYDLSGNVKEWTEARSSGVNPLRGGAMNNPSAGTSCNFNFTVADDNFLFFNAGFRCCYTAP
jgi:formylglycine-generating enzyme required for sulfatase activity